MSSETYTQYSIFTAEAAGVDFSKAADDLFADSSSTVVIVMAEHYSNNTCSKTPRWHIEFIGSASEFSTSYIEKAAYYYDDGISQSQLAKNGKAFKKLMAKLYAQATPLTAAELTSRGYEAYSWDQSDYELISTKCRKIPLLYLGTTRYADIIETDEDAARMVAEAIEIKNGYSEPKGRYRIEKTWLGRPWKLDLYTYHSAHNEAANPMH